MAKGSEQPTWKWAGDTRRCDTCNETLRIKDVGLFYGLPDGTRFIRCMECMRTRTEALIAQRRREMGWAA